MRKRDRRKDEEINQFIDSNLFRIFIGVNRRHRRMISVVCDALNSPPRRPKDHKDAPPCFENSRYKTWP